MKLLALLLTLFCSITFAAHFTGTYFMETDVGGITLTIKHEASGAMVGKLEGNGLVYQLEGEGYPDGAFGYINTDDGIFGYLATLDETGNTIAFYILDLDQEGEPIVDSAEELILQRTSHQANLTPTPSTTPTPNTPTPPTFPKPPSSSPSNQQPTLPNIPKFPTKPNFPPATPSTPTNPPSTNTPPTNNPLVPMPADPWLGTFNNENLTFTLQGDANSYSGTLILGGQSYPVKAVTQGNTMNGSFTSGGNSFEFTASLDVDTLNLTTGNTNYTLERKAGNVPPSSSPANPLLPGLVPFNPSSQINSSLSGEVIEANKDYKAGIKLASNAAGVSFTVPQGYIGSHDAESGTFVLAAIDQSHGISIAAFSKATSGELVEYVLNDIEAEGMEATPVDAPQHNGDTITASYVVSDEQQQLLVYVNTKQGQAGNAIVILGVALPQQKDVLIKGMSEFTNTVSFAAPNGNNSDWQQLLTGKSLSYTGNDSNYSSGGAGGYGSSASETKENFVFCSDGSYVYEYSSEMIFSTGAGSASSSDSDAHQGKWEIGFGLMADPILVLRANDGRFFSYNLEQTANGILLDTGVYSVSASQLCL